jgi:hypothetical protein
MQWHITDFLTERQIMRAADLTIALGRGMSHDLSDWLEFDGEVQGV